MKEAVKRLQKIDARPAFEVLKKSPAFVEIVNTFAKGLSNHAQNEKADDLVDNLKDLVVKKCGGKLLVSNQKRRENT